MLSNYLDNYLLSEFYSHLDKLGIKNLYMSMLKRLNQEGTSLFLTVFDIEEYYKSQKYLTLYKALNLQGETYEQLYPQISRYAKEDNLIKTKLLLQDLTTEMTELLFFKPESFTKLIVHQLTNYHLLQPQACKFVVNEVIQVYLRLSEKYPNLFTCNHNLLYAKNKELFNSQDDYLNIEIARRVVFLQKTLHQLRGTKICILDIESTGLSNPKPIQISYILVDINGKILNTYNRYIKQDYIEPNATASSHNITVQKLLYELPSVDPCEAFEELKSILFADKVIILTHNANYDLRVLNNFIKQNNEEAPTRIFNHLCTFKQYDDFFDIAVGSKSLSSLLSVNKITSEEIQNNITNIFEGVNGFACSPHNALYDSTALLLLVNKSGFIKIPEEEGGGC